MVNRVRRPLLKKMETTIDHAMDTAGLPLLGLVPEDANVQLAAGRGQALPDTGKGAAQAFGNIARRLAGEQVPLMKIPRW